MRHPELSYTSPNRFTLWQRIQLAIIPPLAQLLITLLMKTCKVRIVGGEHYRGGLESRGHLILAIWHETLLMGCWQFRGTDGHTLTSYSFDGELAARVVHRFGVEAVRGSSSRGGAEGLRQLVLAAGLVPIVGFTLDGPRGPRRVAKPGIALLSHRSGLPVTPHLYTAAPAWRLRSWDRFAVPKPFSTMTVGYGPPIAPPVSEDPEVIEAKRMEIETALNRLHAEYGDGD